MEQTAACVINTRSGSFGLHPCKATRSSLRSCLPPTACARAARQSLKFAKFRQSLSFESVEFQTFPDSYNGTGTFPKRRSSRHLQSEALDPNGSREGKDLPLVTFYAGRVHSHRASCRRAGVDNHGRSLLDSPTASVAGLGNAVALVDKARRKSNSLVLTTEDLPRHSRNFERTELGIASQKSLVLPEKASDASRQLCVAVDVDEVLGSFLASLNLFIEETYSVHHDISEYYIYDFMKIWSCTQVEANLRVHAFFDSDHFKNGISPIPGAHQALLQLASYCQLVVVTSRQHVIRDRTMEWIDRYYAGIFKEVHFGNHFAFEGPSRRKSEICSPPGPFESESAQISCVHGFKRQWSLGANILIDDNPRYAIDCAESGIEVLLFDLHGSYPWSKTPCGPQHPLITRVKDWQEVEQALLARTCAEL